MSRCNGFALLLGLAAVPLLAGRSPDKEAKEDRPLSFSLKDAAGREVSLADFKDKKAIVVVFVGTECPVNTYYMPRLKELHDEYAAKGVQFLAVNSNTQDPADRVAEHARKHRVPFPVLKDPDQKVADLFGAERTPSAFVLDSRRAVRYCGRIDDQYGVGFQRPRPNRRDLAEALDEILTGKPVTVARTEAAGCLIGRAREETGAGKITYTKQIARILQKNCQECHRPGQIGPFSLLTYRQARGWAEMIRENVESGRMPPWHADPRHGKFANERRLSKEDREALLAWINEGCPKGDDKDLPPSKEWTEGWWINKPDVVISMQEEFTVPANPGKKGIPYKYFTAPTNFTEDRWIQAAEARPGNRAVVHHIIVTVTPPGQASGAWGAERPQTPGQRGVANYLVGVAPGEEPLVLPPGMGKKIPKGSKLTFQMHYTANGTEQKDRSSVGLIFCKEPPRHRVHTAAILQARFSIPPGDAKHQVVSSATYKKETVIHSFMPHMHLRGRDFEYRAEYPDGKSEVLLSVPRYDFAWQMRYVLAEPKRLPAGTKVVCTAHFDNSKDNPNNPDPAVTVRWGPQTWDEMMIGWMQYYHPEEKIDGARKDNDG